MRWLFLLAIGAAPNGCSDHVSPSSTASLAESDNVVKDTTSAEEESVKDAGKSQVSDHASSTTVRDSADLKRAIGVFAKILSSVDPCHAAEHGRHESACPNGGRVVLELLQPPCQDEFCAAMDLSLDWCGHSEHSFNGTGSLGFFSEDISGPLKLTADFQVIGRVNADCRATLTALEEDKFEGEVCGLPLDLFMCSAGVGQ